MNNELEHFGIKGMKWGVRRFQNEDGSLTEAGKLRYRYQTEEGVSEKAAGKAAKHVTRETKMYDKVIKRMQKRKSVGKSEVEKMVNRRNKIANMSYTQAKSEMVRDNISFAADLLTGPVGGIPVTLLMRGITEYKRTKY